MNSRTDKKSFLPKSALILTGLLLPCLCLADKVQVPLALDQLFIEALVREEIFKGAGGSVRLNDDGSGCQFLELREPRIRFENGSVVLNTTAAARAGRSVGGQCLLILNWHGQLEFTQDPLVGEDRRSILLRTSSWRALRPDGRVDNLSTTIGRWLEQYLPAQIRQTRINLSRPLTQLEEFLALITTPDALNNARLGANGIAIEHISITTDSAKVTLGFDILPAEPPPLRAEPALQADELVLLESNLDAIDAFVTNTISAMVRGDGLSDPAPLLDLMLELRIDLIRILSEPPDQAGDPTRTLFINAWSGLTPFLRVIAGQQTDHQSALRYLSFIGAGDALQALDAIGPHAGIEVSSDGLRRLARILIPDGRADPLEINEAVDTDLRNAFGFGEPIPAAQNFNRSSWLEWFIPSAIAAAGLDSEATRKLNNWVPDNRDMNKYLPMVRDVLQHVISEQLRSKELDKGFHEVYRRLVFTAAWQESCWRQFVAKDAKRVPVQSGSGDVGMMQINPKVWRGFYDLQGLRWDIVYNARAGADILEHHMVNYAIRHREHETTGSVDSLARSAYAAYNGGPRQYNRYRRSDASAHGKKVDTLFYDKYRMVKSDGELAVTACYTGAG